MYDTRVQNRVREGEGRRKQKRGVKEEQGKGVVQKRGRFYVQDTWNKELEGCKSPLAPRTLSHLKNIDDFQQSCS